MAITTVLVKQMVWGRQRVHFGTYADGAGASDDIDTGLRRCEGMIVWEKAAAAPTDAPAVDEDFTTDVDGSAVTMIGSGGVSAGYWLAWGVGRTKGLG